MNTYLAFACLLAVAGLGHGSAIGYGGYGGYGLAGYGGYGYGLGGLGGIGYSSKIISAPILAPAISTANVYKAAPIPIIRTVSAPIITAPVVKTIVPVSYGWNGAGLGSWGGYGLGGYGLGGWGGKGLGGYGLGGYGLGSYGLGGYGLGGWGGKGLGYGGWGKL